MTVVSCVDRWSIPDCKAIVYPYKSRYIKYHKEKIKTFHVQLNKLFNEQFPRGVAERTPY